MNRTVRASIVLLTVLLAGGCRSNPGTSEWMKSVNRIKAGTEMKEVRDELGEPAVKREGETPVRPYPPVGSPEGVLGTLPPETEYRQWIYRRRDSQYHVFFTESPSKPGRWETIAIRSTDAD